MCVYIYQCKEGPHISSTNLNPGPCGDCGREEFTAIVDLLHTVSHSHFYVWSERIKNISYDSPNNQWICRYPCHRYSNKEKEEIEEWEKNRKYDLINGEENGSMNYIFISSPRLLLRQVSLFFFFLTKIHVLFFIFYLTVVFLA